MGLWWAILHHGAVTGLKHVVLLWRLIHLPTSVLEIRTLRLCPTSRINPVDRMSNVIICPDLTVAPSISIHTWIPVSLKHPRTLQDPSDRRGRTPAEISLVISTSGGRLQLDEFVHTLATLDILDARWEKSKLRLQISIGQVFPGY